MNKAVETFLGAELVASLYVPKPFDIRVMGRYASVGIRDCVEQVLDVLVTPSIARSLFASNEYYQKTFGKLANRIISQARVDAELATLYRLMKTDQFAPHQSTIGVTGQGRTVEGQGRLLAQIKAGKTYTYRVDIVKSEQKHIAAYLAASRGTTSNMTPSQLWEVTFGLPKKQAEIAQQVFNGLLWHEEGILGATMRSSTKDAICEKTSLENDLREIVEQYAKTKGPKNVNLKALATLELLAKRKGFSPSKVEEFFTGFITGTNLGARDPRHVTRKFLIERPQGTTMRYQEQIGYMKAAFDKFMQGADVTKTPKSVLVKF
jgi:hypothetical protein